MRWCWMRWLPTDQPYTFRPPIPWDWIRPLGVWYSDRSWLREKYKVRQVEGQGWERVVELCGRGDSVLLAPNHSDHSDPHVILNVTQRHRLPLRFMAARELFDGGGLQAAMLQRMGVFSVDRDGADIAAIKTAINILSAGGSPLVIFPEGEIYHHHGRLDPLMDGVASILLRAAGKLAAGRKAWLVPVAMSFRHDAEVEQTFEGRLAAMETRIGWKPRSWEDVDARILRLGAGILASKEVELFGDTGQGALIGRVRQMCDRLLAEVEERRGKDGKASTAPERVRALRQRMRRSLLDEGNPPGEEERRSLQDDLYRVFTALQAHSYPGDYLLEQPTLDRRAETIMKLEEDLLGECGYPSWRDAKVVAGEPIGVSDFLQSGDLPGKGGAGQLTLLLEEALGALIARS
ncbi:MAG: lysophospholipid acyltransferase family protein [Verrucomicrobia bacterium]|nr:lysophospholipid acyltransferase family protein [Verrucomicrobiota bacterium]